MSKYIHELPNWPAFTWNQDSLNPLQMKLRLQQSKL